MSRFWMMVGMSFGLLASPRVRADRIALIIGNAEYQRAPDLCTEEAGNRSCNPHNDARAMADRLEEIGFELSGEGPLFDLNREQLNDAIYEFSMALEEGDIALFYYAGHGAQFQGANYLVPVNDQRIQYAQDLRDQAYSVDNLVDRLNSHESLTNIFILDACRNNPLPSRDRQRDPGTQGLAEWREPEGSTSIAFYAAAKGQTASDGEGDHGLFTAALLEELQNPHRDVYRIFRGVIPRVRMRSQGAQRPAVYTTLEQEVFLSPPIEDDVSTPREGRLSEEEEEAIHWASIDLIDEEAERVRAIQEHITLYPEGRFRDLALQRLSKFDAEMDQRHESIDAVSSRSTSPDEPSHGRIELVSNFPDDPRSYPVQAGGPVTADTLEAHCVGWIGERPDYVLNYEAGRLPLHVIGWSERTDLTLVVESPQGSIHCADDDIQLNPLVSFENPESGDYRIWVGTYNRDARLPESTILVTERPISLE